MSELPNHDALRLQEYQDYVIASRFPDAPGTDWRDRSSDLIGGEQLEFLTQHGSGMLLLFPEELGIPDPSATQDLRYHMADELSDMLWFMADAADRSGTSIQRACANACDRYIPDHIAPPVTFSELENVADIASGIISVPNKFGLTYGEASGAKGKTALAVNPGYVYMRAVHRVSRGLERGRRDLSPPTATELEPVQETDEAIGIFFLAAAYVARNRLRIPISTVAEFNMKKLDHRAVQGKVNDLQFTEFVGNQE